MRGQPPWAALFRVCLRSVKASDAERQCSTIGGVFEGIATTPENWQKMEALYHAALETSGAERAALLAQSDPEIRRAVEALLAHADSGEGVLDRPAWEQENTSLSAVPQFLPGEQLGCYRLIGKIGVGGMGVVYRARDTKLEREVAIKVLPASVAQDSARRARFEREGKVLASLNHPNIAHIYGVEECALVMELVE